MPVAMLLFAYANGVLNNEALEGLRAMAAVKP